jgi:hypothetical protein
MWTLGLKSDSRPCASRPGTTNCMLYKHVCLLRACADHLQTFPCARAQTVYNFQTADSRTINEGGKSEKISPSLGMHRGGFDKIVSDLLPHPFPSPPSPYTRAFTSHLNVLCLLCISTLCLPVNERPCAYLALQEYTYDHILQVCSKVTYKNRWCTNTYVFYLGLAGISTPLRRSCKPHVHISWRTRPVHVHARRCTRLHT